MSFGFSPYKSTKVNEREQSSKADGSMDLRYKM